MKKLKWLLIGLCMLMFASTQADAKWWIFGQQSEPVSLDYLYANGYNFDDFEKGMTFSRDGLDNGSIHIKGKASADKGRIGKVLVSINGKKEWGKAKLSKDGSFDFVFEPELAVEYEVYVKAIDTTGRSNDIELTHRTITISDQDIGALVLRTLRNLERAYEEKNSAAFMAYVSEDFAGDDVSLSSAIRKDFSLLDDISLDFTVNATASQNGKYYVSITYNRRVTVTKTGETLTDRGVTEFDFTQGKDGLMLYAMKIPLIFGLSDAENVATGQTNSVENSQITIIDSSGDVRKVPFSEAASGASEAATVQSGTFTLFYNEAAPFPPGSQGFIFADSMVSNIGDPTNPTVLTDIFLELNIFWPGNGALIQDLGVDGSGSIDFSHMRAPDTGYNAVPVLAIGNDDHVYAIKLPDNTYGLVKNISSSLSTDGSGNVHSNVTCQYKYREDGGQDF